jgi:acyl carrier protein
MKKLTQEYKDDVKKIFVDLFDIEAKELNDNTRLYGDLGFDDLDRIELVMEIEKKFDCIISNSEWEDVKTISDIYTCLERNIK